MHITWLGHSGFRIEIEEAVLLIDPWLTGNPMFPAGREDEAVAGATHILLTHAHGDHASDAARLAKKLGIKVHCIHELSTWLTGQGTETVGFGKGGTLDLGGAKVTMVNAVHSASIDFGDKGLLPGGDAAGFMIAGEGHTIYVSGDTDIMADMAWMAEYHQPDIGILSLRRALHHGHGARRLGRPEMVQLPLGDPLPLQDLRPSGAGCLGPEGGPAAGDRGDRA